MARKPKTQSALVRWIEQEQPDIASHNALVAQHPIMQAQKNAQSEKPEKKSKKITKK